MPLNAYIPISSASTLPQAVDNVALSQALMMPQSASPQNSMGLGVNNQLAKALRGQHQSPLSNYFGNTFGGSASNDLSAYLPWNQTATANTYGTDPYSQQSLMLAQQDAGLTNNPMTSNLTMDNLGNMFSGWGQGIGDFFSTIGSSLPSIGTSAEEAAPVIAESL
jgi:hypothetical protein